MLLRGPWKKKRRRVNKRKSAKTLKKCFIWSNMAEKTKSPTEPHGLIPLATNSRYSNRSFIRLSQARGLECALAKEPLCAPSCSSPRGLKGLLCSKNSLAGTACATFRELVH